MKVKNFIEIYVFFECDSMKGSKIIFFMKVKIFLEIFVFFECDSMNGPNSNI